MFISCAVINLGVRIYLNICWVGNYYKKFEIKAKLKEFEIIFIYFDILNILFSKIK